MKRHPKRRKNQTNKKLINLLLTLVVIAVLACMKATGIGENDLGSLPPLQPNCGENGGEIVHHTYFSLSYAEEHEQPLWVYYTLSPAMIEGGTSRTDDFRADAKISTGSATLADYQNSGYDRGHLCPAGSMTHNQTAMSETFLLSNMSPQLAGFNRGVWKRLEEAVRKLVTTNGEMYVVTGPVFAQNLGTIGTNSVTIPGAYYKAIYSPSLDQMFAFIVPHASSSADLTTFCVTIDALEALVGIDFFADLDPQLQARLESALSIPKL